MKICFVAAPLIARSGVYNSASELVIAARSAGYDWNAVLGVSERASGQRRHDAGILEFVAEPAGIPGVLRLSRHLLSLPPVQAADLVVTLVPQSDMALSLTRKRWVAYLRGLPWPASGESGRARSTVWRALELAALHRARDVWVTTPLLARETGSVVKRLVPPGIAMPSARGGDEVMRDTFVWAARYSADKNPLLFADALRNTDLRGVMYGTGPLLDRIRAYAPANVTVPGWVGAEGLWPRARAYVGTSSREAFGRSAVEAATLGIPPLISDAFGCAEMLYTDQALAREMVIQSTDPTVWRRALIRLSEDADLHAAAALHARNNAQKLTINSSVSAVLAASRELATPSSRERDAMAGHDD